MTSCVEKALNSASAENQHISIMKESMRRVGGLTVAFCSAIGLLLAFSTQAQIVNLSDGNSTATINTSSQAGMTAWTVNGQNQLAQQWFWYRLGSSGVASSIDTIGAPSITNPDTRHLTTIYTAPSFSVELDYLLSGGNTAGLVESITISNRTASALDFHFFQYSNFRLAGATGSDKIQLGTDVVTGKYNYALQQNSSGIQVQEADLNPSSSHGEANLVTGGTSDTLYKLNHSNPLLLNDLAGPYTGDATWAFEWDYSTGANGLIPANSTEIISKTLSLTVPEPSSAAFVGLGLLALGMRLRRSRH